LLLLLSFKAQQIISARDDTTPHQDRRDRVGDQGREMREFVR
jgi:hypothetical protein